MNDSPLKKPSALVPLGMSLAALAIVLVHAARFGVVHEADEGTLGSLYRVHGCGTSQLVAPT
ncbi:MAG: hypothetical protein WAM91_00600 [Candidatus Acidiferrales bacterium]